ncbi:MAG: TonB-dependent receptor [Pseudomonadota bacterium]
MVFPRNNQNETHTRIKFKKSMLAMCIMAVGAPSFAQAPAAAPSENIEEIVITGQRANLQSAQEIKKNASTFVDSISSEDIGSLPDRSVLEAMSRIPGVSIERFAAANDPDHFGVEGSGAVIRGMSATRSEFNGRDSFTANSGRGLSFQDVPPELMAGVDVYKNQSADMIEGGIGGTVSLRTRKPFDSPERLIAFNLDYSYGDLAEAWTPTVSGLFSDRWETSAGEFGVLVNASSSKLEGSSNGLQSDAYVQYLDDYTAFPRRLDTSNTAAANHAGPNDIKGAERFAEAGQGVWLPGGSNASMKNDERDRKGFAAALQWEDTDKTFLSTTQFMRSDARLSWTENTIGYQSGYDRRRSIPLPGTEYTFDDKGLFQSGTITNDAGFGSNGWRSRDNESTDGIRIPTYADWANPNLRVFGSQYQTATRVKDTHTIIDDFATNFKWTPSDTWEFSVDLQYIKAKTDDDDAGAMLAMNAIQAYDTRGDLPELEFIEPWHGVRDNNMKIDCGLKGGEVCADSQGQGLFGAAGAGVKVGDNNLPGFSDDPAGDSNYFQDKNSYNWQSAIDHYERSEGDSKAARFDVAYNMDGLFTQVKAGIRYAVREQTVRSTTYNWGALFPVFATSPKGLGWVDTPTVGDLNGEWEYVDWSNFQRGESMTVPGDGFLHPKVSLLKDVINGRELPAASEYLDNPWEKMENRVGTGGSLFLPSEVYITEEKNKAAYVRFDFETDIAEHTVKGNIGLRYVELDREAQGATQYPNLVSTTPPPADAPPVTDIAASDAYEQARRAEIEAIYDAMPGKGPYTPITDPNYTPTSVERARATAREKAVNEGFKNGTTQVVGLNSVMTYRNTAFNFLNETDAGFGNNVAALQDESNTYDALLPSFNLAINVTDELIARFAASKAIAQPDMEDVRYTTNLRVLNNEVMKTTRITPNPQPFLQPRTATIAAEVPGWAGDAGNPSLDPMESTQVDASLEWYFAQAGSVTFTLFQKDLSKFFINGSFERTYTNPVSNVTQTAEVTGTINNGEGKLKGFEFAYQQFYDFLPAPFDGLGLQANFSYIDSESVPNTGSLAQDDSGSTDTGARVDLAGLPLKGQSKRTYNIGLMYEKNDWSARLAYNWRSRYLLTTRDVISRFPLWNDDYGTVDASLTYKINDNFSTGIQFTNLTNATTKTIMILDGQDLEAGRSWFVNDRRVSLQLKGSF